MGAEYHGRGVYRGVQGGGKVEDEWHQGGEWTADEFAEKRAKMRGIAMQWALEGNKWKMQKH